MLGYIHMKVSWTKNLRKSHLETKVDSPIPTLGSNSGQNMSPIYQIATILNSKIWKSYFRGWPLQSASRDWQHMVKLSWTIHPMLKINFEGKSSNFQHQKGKINSTKKHSHIAKSILYFWINFPLFQKWNKRTLTNNCFKL